MERVGSDYSKDNDIRHQEQPLQSHSADRSSNSDAGGRRYEHK